MTSGSAGTNGFLFCDLRGYAAFVERAGDRAAAELLETFRRLVRNVIAAHEGAEIRTEGDSVYVVFPTASAAVEAGLGIVAAAATASTKPRPLRVGVGVHAGETVATDEGLVGSAVNIAARVCAKAQAGEVLVTETVRALTRTLLPYRFVGLGTQPLKGIPGGIALYRVEAVPGSRLAHLRRRLAARRRRVALAALGLVVVLVGATAAWAALRPPDCLALGPSTHDVVARIDPARGCVVATYPVGRGPSLAVWAHDKLWVANIDDGTVTVLSPAGRLVATVGAGRRITAMASDGTDMWVLDGDTGWLTSVALDSASVVLGPYLLPGRGEIASKSQVAEVKAALGDGAFATWYAWRQVDYRGLAAEPGITWVSNAATGQIIAAGPGPWPKFQVDTPADPVNAYCQLPNVDLSGCPASAKPDTRPFTGLLAVVGHTVWAAHDLSPDLTALDERTWTATHLKPPGASGPATGLAAMDDDLWVVFKGGQVARVVGGPQEPQVTVATVGSSLAAVAGDANGVWVASPDGHAVIRLDPASLAVAGRIDVGGSASGAAVAPDGSVWVTIK